VRRPGLDGRDNIADRLSDEVSWLRQCAGWLSHLDADSYPPADGSRVEGHFATFTLGYVALQLFTVPDRRRQTMCIRDTPVTPTHHAAFHALRGIHPAAASGEAGAAAQRQVRALHRADPARHAPEDEHRIKASEACPPAGEPVVLLAR